MKAGLVDDYCLSVAELNNRLVLLQNHLRSPILYRNWAGKNIKIVQNYMIRANLVQTSCLQEETDRRQTGYGIVFAIWLPGLGMDVTAEGMALAQ